MNVSFKLFLITFPTFIVIDFIWLGFIANNFYQQQIGFLMKNPISWVPAIIFYLLFCVGLVFFVIMPAVEKKSQYKAIFAGALFGLITYATYDLTNLATLQDWPIVVTVVDIIWGMILGASVSSTVYVIFQKFVK